MMGRTLLGILMVCALLACTLPAVQAEEAESLDEAVRLYNRADQFINAGDYANALILLDQALALNTTQFVSSGARLYALLDKSKAQIELGEYEHALTTIDQALEMEETDKLWNNRGYVLYRLGRYEDAVSSYAIALRITPDYTVALINNGNALMKLGRYEDAIDSYTRAFASDEEADELSSAQKATTWKDTGDAYAALGRYPEAVTAYRSALAIDPGNAGASEGLARAQQKADAGTQMLIIAVIAAVLIACAAAYFLVLRRTTGGKNNRTGPAEKRRSR